MSLMGVSTGFALSRNLRESVLVLDLNPSRLHTEKNSYSSLVTPFSLWSQRCTARGVRRDESRRDGSRGSGRGPSEDPRQVTFGVKCSNQ